MLPFVARFASVCAILTILQKGFLSTGVGAGAPGFGVALAFAVPFLASADIGAALMRRIDRRPTSALALSITFMATYMALYETLSVLFRQVPVTVVALQSQGAGLLMLAFIAAALVSAIRLGLAFGERLGSVPQAGRPIPARRTAFAFGDGRLSLAGLLFRFMVVCVAMTALHGVLAVVLGMRSPVLAFGAPVMAGALAAGDHAARQAGIQLEGVQAWLVSVVGATLHTLIQFALLRIALPFGWLGAFDVTDMEIAIAFAPVGIAIAALLARMCLSLGARAGAARRLDKRPAA